MYGCFILGIVSQVTVVKYLSAQDYGKFAIILMVVSLIQVPINIHSGEIILRYSKPNCMSVAFTKMINLLEIKLFLIGSFLLLLILLLVYDINFTSYASFLVILLFLPTQYSFAVTKVMFTIADSMQKLSKIELIFNLLKLLIYYTALQIGGLEFLLLGHLVFLTLKTLIIKFSAKSLPLSFDHEDIKFDKKYSVSSIFRSFLQQTSANADLIVVSLFLKLETVALYKVAKVICQSIFVTQQPIWRALQPKLYQSFKQKDKSNQFIKLINQGIIQSVIFFIPVCTGLYLFGNQIVLFLYGSDYESAINIIMILLFTILFYNIFVGWFKVWAINTENLILPLLTYSTIILSYLVFPYFLNIIDVISLTYLFTFVNLAVFIFLYFYIRGEQKAYLLHS